MIKIAPSTDPAKSYDELLEYINEIKDYAHFLHIDVMNKNFVGKTNFDETFVKNINEHTIMMLDVHLMIKKPDVLKYINAGANVVTIHYEAFDNKKDLIKALRTINANKTLVGLSLNPETEISLLKPFLKYCNIILLMTVEPGKSGQKFMDNGISRLQELKKLIGNRNIQIEVDGGINPDNAKLLKDNGANILVSGSYIFSSKDRVKAIKELIE